MAEERAIAYTVFKQEKDLANAAPTSPTSEEVKKWMEMIEIKTWEHKDE
ncbi:hypothetical protein [Rhizobium sp. LEGMi135b]